MKIRDLIERGKYIMEIDPAAKTLFEAIFLYPVNRALFWHDIAHKLYKKIILLLQDLYHIEQERKQELKFIPGLKLESFYL